MSQLQSKQSNRKVSVCVITYNHEPYIRQCLDSVLCQNVDFEFEVVVGVDLSSDRTLEIVNEYALNHPGRMRVLANAERIGGCQNYLKTHDAASGDYIAVLDGDDVMFPGKLAIQSSFLDAHPELGVVWHTMERSRDFSSSRPAGTYEQSDVIYVTLSDQIAFGALGAHSSKMYRSTLKYAAPSNETFLDYDISVYQLQRSKGALMIGSPLGGYRANSGISATDPSLLRSAVRGSLASVNEALPQFRNEITAFLVHEFLHAGRRLWVGTDSMADLLYRFFRVGGLILYVSTYGKRKSIIRGIFS